MPKNKSSPDTFKIVTNNLAGKIERKADLVN